MRVEKLLRAHLLELALAGSFAVHAGAVVVLPKTSPAKPGPRTAVQFVTLPAAPRPTVEEVPAQEVEPPAQKPPPKATPKAPPTPPAPKPENPVPPSELTGRTLTTEGTGASFAAPAGNDGARTEPIAQGVLHAPAPAPRPPASTAVPRPIPPSPATVALQDLARRPEPPALAGVLARYYPEDARRRGVGGQAIVRARVDADGKVRTASVASESDPGFGAACQRTLVGSRWSPPLGRDGRPVATWVRYTCRFRVGL